MKNNPLRKLVIAGFVLVLALVVFALSFRPVGAGEVGVVRRFGQIQTYVLTEGPNFVAPFLDSVYRESIRVRISNLESTAASRDLQDVKMTFAVNYQIDHNAVIDLHRGVGADFENVILGPAIQESVTASTAAFSAEEIITRRTELSEKIVEELSSRVNSFGIRVIALNIIDVRFSAEFEQAIEDRNVAEQRVRQAEQELARAEVNARQLIVEAQAEADSMAILNQEITAELLQRLWIETWNGVMPQVVGNDGTSFLMQLPTAGRN